MKDLTSSLDRGPRQQRQQITSSGIIRQGQLQRHHFTISIIKPFLFMGNPVCMASWLLILWYEMGRWALPYAVVTSYFQVLSCLHCHRYQLQSCKWFYTLVMIYE
jgi:hypothetical protein